MCNFPKVLTLVELILTNFREHVSSYWPNPGTKGSQVQSMYDRLAAIDTGSAGKEAGSSAEGAKANGKTNGVVIKQE